MDSAKPPHPGRSAIALAAALIAALVPLVGGATAASTAPIPPAGFSDSFVASVASPIGLAFTPDGRLLIAT